MSEDVQNCSVRLAELELENARRRQQVAVTGVEIAKQRLELARTGTQFKINIPADMRTPVREIEKLIKGLDRGTFSVVKKPESEKTPGPITGTGSTVTLEELDRRLHSLESLLVGKNSISEVLQTRRGFKAPDSGL